MKVEKKLRGLSPLVNYTDWATAYVLKDTGDVVSKPAEECHWHLKIKLQKDCGDGIASVMLFEI
jgi:hypothetical protein